MKTPTPTELSTPLILKNGISIKNRLFKSAMSEQLGDENHNPTPGLIRLYKTWADGGIGLSVTGNVMIDRTALGEPKNVVLDRHSFLSLFEQWAAAGKQNGSSIWIQLNHPGKQTPRFLTKEPVAPSAIPLTKGLEKSFNTPRALTEPEILEIIEKFGQSAALAKQAGFSGVQIHGAHGYLVSQFLSPHHNQRTDQWGGSLDNRMRFVLNVYRKIREKVGNDYPVGIKLNSADFMKSGFSQEDSMVVVKQLQKEGIDLVEISGGTYESPSMVGYNGHVRPPDTTKNERTRTAGRELFHINAHGLRPTTNHESPDMAKPINSFQIKVKESTLKREAYFLEYAEKVREKIDVPFVVTGGFRSRGAMESALESGATDMIGLARPLAVDPAFPNELLTNNTAAIAFKEPTTGSRTVDSMTMMSILWYEFQLERIARGKHPDPDLNAWYVVFQTLGRMGAYAFTKRRM